MNSKNNISREELKKLVNYNPETGKFTWKVARNSRAGKTQIGHEAGRVKSNGYIYVGLNGKRYLAHRLAWFYVHNEWPNEIDHINGNREDNRLSNLRLCNRSQNNANNRNFKKPSSGYRNVWWANHCGKWRVQLRCNGELIQVGYFDDIGCAVEARNEKIRECWGDFAVELEYP